MVEKAQAATLPVRVPWNGFPEVIVHSSKYLRIWTTNLAAVRRVLEAHLIPEVTDLRFIDEYPTAYETLPDAAGNAGWAHTLERLTEAFAKLETVPPSGA